MVDNSREKSVICSRLDQTKCEHFLDFIFTSGILYDVAYGITKLKYDTGEEQKIAHAILMIYHYLIQVCEKSCMQ